MLHRGTVRIAVNTGNEPRQFADENRNLQSYDIDIAGALAPVWIAAASPAGAAGRVAMLRSHKFAPPAGRGSG